MPYVFLSSSLFSISQADYFPSSSQHFSSDTISIKNAPEFEDEGPEDLWRRRQIAEDWEVSSSTLSSFLFPPSSLPSLSLS